jgi:hypothetical protein
VVVPRIFRGSTTMSGAYTRWKVSASVAGGDFSLKTSRAVVSRARWDHSDSDPPERSTRGFGCSPAVCGAIRPGVLALLQSHGTTSPTLSGCSTEARSRIARRLDVPHLASTDRRAHSAFEK